MREIVGLEAIRWKEPWNFVMKGNVPGVDFRRKAMDGRRRIILQLGCFESSSCSRYLFN